jgi:hypothetical protein
MVIIVVVYESLKLHVSCIQIIYLSCSCVSIVAGPQSLPSSKTSAADGHMAEFGNRPLFIGRLACCLVP